MYRATALITSWPRNFNFELSPLEFLNYIFNNSSAGKKVNKDVKNQTSKLNSELKKYIDKINDDKKKLMAQKNVLSKEEFEKYLN